MPAAFRVITDFNFGNITEAGIRATRLWRSSVLWTLFCSISLCVRPAFHSQTDFNALMICQGRRLNPPLNKVGREQAGHLAAQVAVSAIFCSPLVRAHETAGIVQAR